MTPEEKALLTDVSNKLNHLIDVYYRTHFIDKDVFNNPVYFNGNLFVKDGSTISTGGTTGLKIGNSTTEKIGFYGETPVDQPATVSDPSGGATQDAEARTAISTVIDRLQELGLIA